MIKDLFKKKKYATMDIAQTKQNTEIKTKPLSTNKQAPLSKGEILCKKCGKKLNTDILKTHLNTCDNCGFHYKVSAMDRINILIDEDSFICFEENLNDDNPLDFPGYEEKITNAKNKTGLDEGVISGIGQINGIDTVICIMESDFIMGSMGIVVGEKITMAIERAMKEELPIIICSASGGARMQEGILSLMQMAKTSAALKRLSDKGLLYVSVFTDPTTGGVTASFAMLGDIILSEPGALIGFAGPRVIEQTIKKKLPEGFQRAEFLKKKGFVDKVVHRKDLKDILFKILKIHGYGGAYNE